MKMTSKRAGWLALACSSFLATVSPAAAACSNEPVKVKMAAGRLDTRLQDISHKTGCPLMVDPDIVGSKRAPAVRGTYTVAQMLNLSLLDSGLVSTWQDGQWVVDLHE